MNLGQHLRRNARRIPNDIAIIDRGQSISWRELDEVSDRFAAVLQARGAEHGARIMTFMDNSAPPLVAYAAAVKHGFVLVPLNYRLAARELREAIEDAAPALVLFDVARADVVRSAVADLEGVVTAQCDINAPLGEALGLPTGLTDSDSPPESVVVNEDDLALLIFTSGTTGRAKGVCLTHGQELVHAPVAAVEYDLGETSRSLVAYPYSSAASWSLSIVPSMMTGATLVTESVSEFRAPQFIELLQRHRITHTNVVPTQLIRMLECEDIDQYDLTALVTIGYGSAPLPPDRVRRALELFGPIFVQVYGMSELCSIATMLSKSAHVRGLKDYEEVLASCGRPSYLVEVEVVDLDDCVVPVGEVGEIRFRGPHVSERYWQNETATVAAFRDGWLYSGDLARVDESGFVYIVDRKKDMILSGGSNVASKEVEDVLFAHPDVLECAVVGVPDAEWGERVHAVVVLRGDAGEDQLGQLTAWCREQLANYKRPKTFEIRRDLPKNATGKVLKNRLREEAAA